MVVTTLEVERSQLEKFHPSLVYCGEYLAHSNRTGIVYDIAADGTALVGFNDDIALWFPASMLRHCSALPRRLALGDYVSLAPATFPSLQKIAGLCLGKDVGSAVGIVVEDMHDLTYKVRCIDRSDCDGDGGGVGGVGGGGDGNVARRDKNDGAGKESVYQAHQIQRAADILVPGVMVRVIDNPAEVLRVEKDMKKSCEYLEILIVILRKKKTRRRHSSDF